MKEKKIRKCLCFWPNVWARLVEISKQENRSISSMVEEFIREYDKDGSK